MMERQNIRKKNSGNLFPLHFGVEDVASNRGLTIVLSSQNPDSRNTGHQHNIIRFELCWKGYVKNVILIGEITAILEMI